MPILICRHLWVLLALLVTGLTTPTEAIEQPKEKPRVDALGDPLPPGAGARLGTRRFQTSTVFHEPTSVAGGQQLLIYHAEPRDWSITAQYRWLDASTGKVVDTWSLPKGLAALGVSADGKWAMLTDRGINSRPAAAGLTFQLHLYDLERKQEAKIFKGVFDERLRGAESFGAAIFSPDARWCALVTLTNGPRDGFVQLWDIATGKQVWKSPFNRYGNLDQFEVVGFTPGSDSLILRRPGDEGRILVLDLAQAKIVRQFTTDTRVDQSWNYGISPDGAALVRGRQSTQLQVWDLKTGKELPSLGGHKEPAAYFAFAPDGRTLVTASSQEASALVRDWPSGKVRQQVELGRSGLKKLFLSADSKTLYVLFDFETMLHRYDLQSGKALPLPAKTHLAGALGLALTPDGMLVSLGRDKTVRTWNLAAGQSQPVRLDKLAKLHPAAHPWIVPEDLRLAVSADGKRVAVADGTSGGIVILDRQSGKELRTIVAMKQGYVDFCGLALSPDGKFMAASAGFGAIAGWDTTTGKLIDMPMEDRDSRSHRHGLGRLAFSPDGRYLAETNEAAVLLRTVGDWKVIGSLLGNGPYGHPSELAFSADSRMLACADYEEIEIWEVATRKLRGKLAVREKAKPKPGEAIYLDPHFTPGLCFSPNGRYLALATTKHVVEVWDLIQNQRVAEFQGHEGRIEGMTFTHGKQLVTASLDGTLLIWDVAHLKMPAAKPLQEKELEAAWDNLASLDAAKAFSAVRGLVTDADHCLPRLRAGLPVVAVPDPAKLRQLLADLDNKNFAAREKARKDLETLGDLAVGPLKAFLAGGASIEGQRRAEQILAEIAKTAAAPERLQQLRAVEVLERIATPAARSELKRLAGGAPEAGLTRDAAAALKRLEAAK